MICRWKIGRRNRGKQKDSSSQQQNQCHSHSQSANKDNQNHLNVVRQLLPLTSRQSESCKTCIRLEFELKTMRNDINQLKQSENELQRKCDQTINVKSTLQAKQKVNEELEKR